MAHIGLPSVCVTGTCHREVKESLQRQCQRPPFHQRSGSLSYFRSAIVLVLSAKNVYLRPATNHHLQGWFFKLVIVLSRFLTLTLSPSPIIFLLRQFDRFQERLCFSQRVLEAVAADVSDNHPQPKATAVPWLHLLVISRNAYPNTSTLREPSQERDTFCHHPIRWFFTFVKEKKTFWCLLKKTCCWFSQV